MANPKHNPSISVAQSSEVKITVKGGKTFSLDKLLEMANAQSEAPKTKLNDVQKAVLEVLETFQANASQFPTASWVTKQTVVSMLDGTYTLKDKDKPDTDDNHDPIDETRIASALNVLASDKAPEGKRIMVAEKLNAGKGKAPLYYSSDPRAEFVAGKMGPRS